MVANSTAKDKNGMLEKLKSEWRNFYTATIKLHSKVDGLSKEKGIESSLKTLDPFIKKYADVANKNYVNRGHHFVGSSLIGGDLGICGKIKF